MTSDSRAKPKIAPFTVLADNREQHPYRFDPAVAAPLGFDAVRVEQTFLPTGDYSLAGCEDRFAVERKTLEDLYATLGQGRRRFEAEFERLGAMEFAAVVVEADLAEIWRPADARDGWRSRLHPKSVEGTIVSWSIRYPQVHWWTVGSRRAGEIRVLGACEKFWKHQQKEKAHGSTRNNKDVHRSPAGRHGGTL